MSLGGYELSVAINRMPLCIYVRTKCCPEVAVTVGPRVVGKKKFHRANLSPGMFAMKDVGKGNDQ